MMDKATSPTEPCKHGRIRSASLILGVFLVGLPMFVPAQTWPIGFPYKNLRWGMSPKETASISGSVYTLVPATDLRDFDIKPQSGPLMQLGSNVNVNFRFLGYPPQLSTVKISFGTKGSYAAPPPSGAFSYSSAYRMLETSYGKPKTSVNHDSLGFGRLERHFQWTWVKPWTKIQFDAEVIYHLHTSTNGVVTTNSIANGGGGVITFESLVTATNAPIKLIEQPNRKSTYPTVNRPQSQNR